MPEQSDINRNATRSLVLILTAFAVLSLIYSLATWLKYGPDEPAHFIYIRSIATKLALPPISNQITTSERSISTHAGHHPPLYYAIMALLYSICSFLGIPSDVIWRILRLLGIGIGVIWIYWVYRLAHEHFQNTAYALATAAFVALIPNAAYTAGVLNNEILIALLFTWALAIMTRYFKAESLSRRDAATLGVVIGLAALSKAQGLILSPVFLIISIAVCRRRQYANYKSVLTSLGIVLATAIIVGGWWFVRCWIVHGSVMPRSLYHPVLPHGLASALAEPALTLYTIFLATRDAYGYFWTPFWLLWKYVTGWAYFWPVLGITAAAIAGLIVRAIRRNLDRNLWVLLFTALTVWVSWVRYVLVVDSMANLQGRLFMCVAGVIGIAFVTGFDTLLPTQRAKKIAVAVGIIIMILGNITVIGCELAFYASGGV